MSSAALPWHPGGGISPQVNSAARLAALQAAEPADQAARDAENAAEAAAKDAAAKALAVPKMPQTQQRRRENVKHAQNEADAAADKAAQLATVYKAKHAELRFIVDANVAREVRGTGFAAAGETGFCWPNRPCWW